MDKPPADSLNPSMDPEPPAEDDFEGLFLFYERTGAMAVSTIGPPIDRPIVPSRRPDRVGDFYFTTQGADAPAAPARTTPEDPEAKEIRREFIEMLDEELRGP